MTKDSDSKNQNSFREITDEISWGKYFSFVSTLYMYYTSPKVMARAVESREWGNLQKPYLHLTTAMVLFFLVVSLHDGEVRSYALREKVTLWISGFAFVFTMHVCCSAPKFINSKLLATAFFLSCYWLGTILFFVSLIPLVEVITKLPTEKWPDWWNYFTPLIWWPILVSPFLAFKEIYKCDFERYFYSLVLSGLVAAALCALA